MTMKLLNSKKLFLIDGLGALLSAFLLGIILVRFESVFGMLPDVLHFLAAIACVLAAYSLTRYFLTKTPRGIHFKIIGWANLAYCCLTLAAMLYFSNQISLLGILYFSGEIGIILTLAMLELRAGSQLR